MTFLTEDEKKNFHETSGDSLERCLAWFPHIAYEESQYLDNLIRGGLQIAIVPPESGGVEIWSVDR